MGDESSEIALECRFKRVSVPEKKLKIDHQALQLSNTE